MPDSALLDQLLAISDDELAKMPAQDQRWVAAAIERELLLRSPADFATGLSHNLWQPYRHLVHTSDAIVGMYEDDDCDILLIEQSVRHGKALALDTPIATPTGWARFGDLVPGDELFDDQGQVCRVVELSPTWTDPSFAVSTDDGDEIVCHENHEWPVRLAATLDVGVKETRWLASRSQRVIGDRPDGLPRHPVAPAVDMARPLNLPYADLPIDPYTFGAWLGDGSSTHATMHGDGGDDQKWIRYRITEEHPTTDRADSVSFGVLGILVKLRAMGVLGNKHVPMPYLRASIAQRTALLQGLMDTDGHVAPDGQCEFCSTNSQLALAVQELVRSLGRKATIITGSATLDGRDCGLKYRVMFYMDRAASLPRKADRCRDAIVPRRRRYLTFAETAPVPTRCIEVDSPSHLFLAGWSMTPTRNTELCSRWTPAWAINKFRIPVLLASYEADFAATHGRRVREIVKENGPRFGVEINEQSRAANRWECVGGGGMGTAGAGGPITGKGGKLLIVDDPIKNSEDANSPVMREKLWDWWQGTFLTRREPGAKVIVIMSRWHEDDLIGRILKMGAEGARVKRVRLPAIAEDDDPIGRTPGEALCPERYDEQALAGIRSDVGPTAWAALYQQRPTPVGGGMFRRQWFIDHPYTVETANDKTWYRLGSVDDEGGHLVDADEMFKFCTMDTAYSRTKRSDYTAIATWGVVPTDPSGMVLLDMDRVRVGHNDHAPLVKRVWDQWKPAWVGIEKQSANLSMFDEVQRQGVVVRWLTPDKNKVARAETATAMVESGRIWFPTSASWFADFLDEVLTFPVGKHDDMVDTLSYAANELSKRAVRAHRRREKEPETPGDRMWARLKERQKVNNHHPILGRLP